MNPASAAALTLAAAALLAAIGGDPPPATAPPADAPDFQREVLPLLQRQGCASAYCHGSATGQAGFKLSLFGGDPDADWRALAVDLAGRRLDLQRPDGSLLLQKPSLGMPHGGGLRLPRDGRAYAILRNWIAAGAPRTATVAAAPIVGLQLHRDGGRVRAVAMLADGGSCDVSHLVQFATSDPRVAEVDADGNLFLAEPGEAAVTARYGGHDAVLQVMQPLAKGERPAPEPAPGHGLDRALRRHLDALGLAPGPEAALPVVLRRLHLDLAARIPTADELTQLQRMPRAQALTTAVAALTGSPDFVAVFADHLARWWDVPAVADAPPGQEARVRALRQQLHAAVRDRRTIDQLADSMLVAGHPLLERLADPRDRADYVARAFFGIRLGCARCHDHPLDRWQQTDHLGFSALLATRRLGDGSIGPGACYDDEGQAAAPVLLPLAEAPPADLDAYGQVRWLATAGSDALARNVANRLLGLLLGIVPVLPEDDHRATNPARLGGLLTATVAEYRRTGGDLRALATWIVTSDAYARASAPGTDDVIADRLAAESLARRTARTLPPATWHRAAATALGLPLPMPMDGATGDDGASPLGQRLAAENGSCLDDLCRQPGGLLDRLAGQADDPAPAAAQALEALFLAALCRAPLPAEREALLPTLTTGDRRDALTALAKALFLSREFGSWR